MSEGNGLPEGWVRVNITDVADVGLGNTPKKSDYRDTGSTGWSSSEMSRTPATIDPGRSNGVPHISTRQVERMEINLPPLSEQAEIVGRVKSLLAAVIVLERHLSLADDAHTAFSAAAVD